MLQVHVEFLLLIWYCIKCTSMLFNKVNNKELKSYLCGQHCLAMHMWQDSLCSWTKGHCSSLHVVSVFLSIIISWVWRLLSEAVPPTYHSVSLPFFPHCFISVFGACFSPSMWGPIAGLLVFQ